MAQNERYELVTFDVYTALSDIANRLAPSVSQLIHLDGPNCVRAWRRKHLEFALISNSLGRGRFSFEVITRRALDDTQHAPNWTSPNPQSCISVPCG